MTRKEALKEIAQRCMDGDDVDATELYNVFGKRPDMEAMESLAFYIALPLSLDAVAKLELELLPENLRMEIVSYAGRFQVYYAPIIYQPFESFHTKFCDTEPLARLAALCLALAEIEE